MLTPHDAPAIFIRMVTSKNKKKQKKTLYLSFCWKQILFQVYLLLKNGGRVLTAFFGGIIIDSPFFSSVAWGGTEEHPPLPPSSIEANSKSRKKKTDPYRFGKGEGGRVEFGRTGGLLQSEARSKRNDRKINTRGIWRNVLYAPCLIFY